MNEKMHKGFSLRIGRFSQFYSQYFLTFCTEGRQAKLANAEFYEHFLKNCEDCQNDGVFELLSFTVMPDHLHLLIRLGERLSLGKTVARIKAKSGPVLKTTSTPWQKGFYDHRLRHDEDRLPVFLYIYLNPYRKLLITAEQQWAYYYCVPNEWAWLSQMLKEDCPLPEWLQKPQP